MRTVDDILALKEELLRHYGPARNLMNQAKDYYDLKLKNQPTPSVQFPSYIPPTARAVIDKAVDHVIVGNPVVTVPKRKATDEAQDQADKLERFYTAFLRRLDGQQKEPVLRTAAKFGLLCGMFVIKGPLWNRHTAGIKPKRKSGEGAKSWESRESAYESQKRFVLPVYAQAIDPTTVLISPGSYPPQYVIEVTKKSSRYLKDRWGLDTASDDAEWVEYWDKDMKCYICEGKAVKGPEENIYGYIPYLAGYAGLGYASEKPEDEIAGLLTPVFSALELQGRIMTALDFIIQRFAYPSYYTPGDPAKLIVPEPGQIGHAPSGLEPLLWPTPQTLPDLYRVAQMAESHIERATYSDVLAGVADPANESGYRTDIRVGQAKTKFATIVDALEMQGSLLLSNVARLIEIEEEPLTVWASTAGGNLDETVGPDDINGHYTAFLKLASRTPEETDAQSLLGLKLWQAGGISQLRFLENYASISDANAEMRRILVEQGMKNPMVNQVLTYKAMVEWGLKKLQEELDPTVLQAILQSVGGMPQMQGQSAAQLNNQQLVANPPSAPTNQTMPGSFEEVLKMAQMRTQQRTGGTAGIGMETPLLGGR